MKNRKRVEIIFWVIIFLLSFAFHSQILVWYNALLRAFSIVVMFMGIMYYNTKILIPNFFNRKGYLWYVLNAIVILIVVPSIFAYTDLLFSFDFRVEFHPLNPLKKGVILTRDPEQLKFVLSFLITALIFAGSLAYKATIDYIEKQKQKLELEKQKIIAEMSFLKTQMNPHFFLNAMNGLYALSRLSPKKTGEYITKLSEMLRYLTYEGSKETVPLIREIDYIKNYIYFQEYKNDLIKVEWNENILNGQYPIEPMLLMPFVENAFKHSFSDSEEDKTIIKIRVTQNEEELNFKCGNSLPKKPIKKADPNYSGIGIDNVKTRLEAKYQESYKLKYGIIDNIFKVELKIDSDG